MSELTLKALLDLQNTINGLEHDNFILNETNKDLMIEIQELTEKYEALVAKVKLSVVVDGNINHE